MNNATARSSLVRLASPYLLELAGLFVLLAMQSAAAQTRDARYWPFSQNSPWNRPIGQGAIFKPISAASPSPFGGIYTKWMNTIPDINVYKTTVSIPVATLSDPIWTLYDNKTYGTAPPPYNNGDWYAANTGSGFNQGTFCQDNTGNSYQDFIANSYRPNPSDPNSFIWTYNPWSVAPAFAIGPVNQDYSATFYLPLNSCGSPNYDGLMSAVQPSGTAVDLFAPIVVLSSSAVVSQNIGTFYDLTGDGTGFWNGRRASLIPNMAGVIRQGEVGTLQAAGNIPHALAVYMSPDILTAVANGVSKTAGPVWPAYSYDVPNNGNYQGGKYGLPMGSLLAIPPSYTLIPPGSPGSQFFSFPGYTLAVAAQRYGVYIVDTGSVGVMNFMAELNDPDFAPFDPPSNPTLEGASLPLRQNCTIPSQSVYCDMVVTMTYLQVVMNNSQAQPGGPNPNPNFLAPPFGN